MSGFFPDAGKRDHRVTIQAKDPDAVDAAGAPVETWDDLYTGYFEKVVVGGRERFASNQMTSPYDTRWRGNYRADMDRDLVNVPKERRLVYKSRVYDIVDAQVIGRNLGIELLTLAGGTYS